MVLCGFRDSVAHIISCFFVEDSSTKLILFNYFFPTKAFDLVDHNLLIAKLYSQGVKPTVINWVAYFLRNRYQRVKLNSDCFSDFKPVPAGIPQGTWIGPWLFLVMINDLTTSNTLSSMWKFADDTTVSEIVPKFGDSMFQDTVHDVLRWSNVNRFKLNSLKCKELRIDFRRESNLDTVS